MKQLLAGLVLITLLLTGCGEQKETLKIGVLFPMTGFAEYLKPVKYGIDLAVDEINNNNLFNNKKIEIIYKDSESQTGLVETLFKEFMAEEVDMILPVLSNVSNTLSPLTGDNEMPIVALVASDPKVTTHNKYTFRYYQIARDESIPMFQILTNENIEDIGVLYQNEDYGKSIYQDFLDNRGQYNLRVTGSPFEVAEKDFEQVVSKILTTKAVVIAGFEANCISLLKELRKQNYQGLILGTSTLSSEVFWNLEEAQGIYVSAPTVYNPNYRIVNDLSEKFKKAYNLNLHHNSAIGYDVIYLLNGLLKDEDKIDKYTIYMKLQGAFIFPGIFGDIKKEAGEQEIAPPLYPAQIQNNKLDFIIY